MRDSCINYELRFTRRIDRGITTGTKDQYKGVQIKFGRLVNHGDLRGGKRADKYAANIALSELSIPPDEVHGNVSFQARERGMLRFGHDVPIDDLVKTLQKMISAPS